MSEDLSAQRIDVKFDVLLKTFIRIKAIIRSEICENKLLGNIDRANRNI